MVRKTERSRLTTVVATYVQYAHYFPRRGVLDLVDLQPDLSVSYELEVVPQHPDCPAGGNSGGT